MIRKTNRVLRRVIHKFCYDSKYIDRNRNRLSTTNRQAIFPKKIPQEISWLNAFLKSFTSRGSSNDRVTIHFENCGLLVKRFTDPIRISITRLGDYNIISIHQMDNIDGWNDRWFDISCTKRHVLPTPARILHPRIYIFIRHEN